MVHFWYKINSLSSAVSFYTFCCIFIKVTLHCITKCAAKLPVYSFEFPSVPWRQTTVFQLTLISITKHGTTFAMLIGYRCSFDSGREDSNLFWTTLELAYHDKWQNSRLPYLQLSDVCIYRYIPNLSVFFAVPVFRGLEPINYECNRWVYCPEGTTTWEGGGGDLGGGFEANIRT